jgi:tellurite resistance protein
MAEPPILQLPEVDPTHLAVVIRGILADDLAQAERLRAGAAQSLARADTQETTGRFLALLDIAYLVAAADGLDADERNGILRLFEQLTDGVLDRDALEHHFTELDESMAGSSPSERLGAAAADLRDEDRTNAISFAAAIAMSDGWLGEAELGVLKELGGFLGVAADKTRDQVEQVIQRVEGRLR